jgi:4-aminobutyrate aminotransferase-like enzyme
VAAFIMEPVISGGGVLVPPDNYIPRVREICDRHGVLLIYDEVVSGSLAETSPRDTRYWRSTDIALN